jgi:hypothetical protein
MPRVGVASPHSLKDFYPPPLAFGDALQLATIDAPNVASVVDPTRGNTGGSCKEGIDGADAQADVAEGTCHDCNTVASGWTDETNGSFYCSACWDRFEVASASDASEDDAVHEGEAVPSGLKRKREHAEGGDESEASDEEAAEAEAARRRRILQELAGWHNTTVTPYGAQHPADRLNPSEAACIAKASVRHAQTVASILHAPRRRSPLPCIPGTRSSLIRVAATAAQTLSA